MRDRGGHVHDYRPRAKKQEIGRDEREKGMTDGQSAFFPSLQGMENQGSSTKKSVQKAE